MGSTSKCRAQWWHRRRLEAILNRQTGNGLCGRGEVPPLAERVEVVFRVFFVASVEICGGMRRLSCGLHLDVCIIVIFTGPCDSWMSFSNFWGWKSYQIWRLFFWGWKSYHKYEEVETSEVFFSRGKTRRTGMVKTFSMFNTPPQMPLSCPGKKGLRSGIMVATIIPERSLSHSIHVWYIYLHENHKNQPNVGEYTSPMDPKWVWVCLGTPMMIHPSIFQVPSFADGPSVTIGRHGARRGVTAPVMQVSTEKLKELKGAEISTSRWASNGFSSRSFALGLINTLSNSRRMSLPGFVDGSMVIGSVVSISHLYNPYTPED